LNWRTPIEWLLGYTPDITTFLQFEFWEPVYYSKYDATFPEDPTELLGRFVGISEHVGNAMTFKVMTSEEKIISRAVVRSAMKGGAFTNKRADQLANPLVAKFDPLGTVPLLNPIQGEEEGSEESDGSDTEEPKLMEAQKFEASVLEDIVRSKREDAIERGGQLPTMDPSTLLGRTFINDPDEEGNQQRATIESIEPTDATTPDKQELSGSGQQ
jgi:hypothetical protein